MAILEHIIYPNLASSYKIKLRYKCSPLQDISSVKMSGLQDNFFVISVPTEYDYLFVSRLSFVNGFCYL